ncbi:MAG: DUF11 domain-containing protein [Rubripirellula sp.]
MKRSSARLRRALCRALWSERSAASRDRFRPRLEALEDRRLLVAAVDLAAITGRIFDDTSGNGFDIGEEVSDAAVDLFIDTNNSGQFERSSDAANEMTMTGPDGRYRFDRLVAGRYFVVQQANAMLDLQERVSSLIVIDSDDIKGRITTTIDSFDTATQLVEDTTQGDGPATSVITAGVSDVIGGERDLFAEKTSQNGAVQLNVNSILLPGQLIFSSPATGVGVRRITWDGVDGDATNVNDTGLPNVDLASNSVGIQLQIRADQGGNAVLRVYSAGRISSATIPIPQTQGTFLSAELIPFTDFTPTVGGGADFSSVTAIELEITGVAEVNGAAELIAAVGTTDFTQDFDNFETANLNLTKTVNDSQPNVGQEVTFTIAVNNAGPENATGVEVTDLLPSGIRLVRANTASGSYNSGTGVWTAGAIANGGTATLELTGVIESSGVKTNTAQITATNQFDSNVSDNQDSADVTPQTINLSLSKVASDSRPNLNEDVTFTVTVTNAGVNAATNVSVRDQLPSGLNLLSAVPTRGSFNTSSGVWTIPEIGVGESVMLPIVANVSTTGTFTNTAEVIGADQFDVNSTPGNGDLAEDDIDSAAITTPIANLTLTKQVNNSVPNVGEQVTFTIEVTNAGPDLATNVEVTDLLPSGLTDRGSNVDAGGFNSGTGIWDIGDLAVNQTATLTVFAEVDPPSVGGSSAITNTAEITASDQSDSTSTPNNNISSEDDQDSATINPPSVDLGVTKSINNARPNVGDEIEYTVRVTNTGPNNASGILIRDQLPTGLTLLAADETRNGYNNASGVWNVGTLANSASATLVLRARVDSASALTNTAAVQAVDQFDTNAANDQASVGFTLASADLGLTKSVDVAAPNVGDQVNFTITVRNPGPDPASGISIRDQLPAGATFVSASETFGSYNETTGVWSIPSLGVNDSATLTLRATATTTNLVTNSAQIIAADQRDPNPSDNLATADIRGQQVDVSLTKSLDNDRPNVGDEVTFLITVRNDGPSAATGVEVTDSLPAGVALTGNLPSRGSFNTSTRVWTVGRLESGDSGTLELTTRVDQVLTNAVNLAQVTATNEPDVDSTPGNSLETEDDQQSVAFSTPVSDLVLAKSVSNDSPNVGDTVTFTVQLQNNGPDTATSIVVADLLPTGLGFQSNSLDAGSYDSVSGNWAIGQLANGGSATLSINAIVASRGEKVNTARVLSVDQFDPTSMPGNNIESEDDQASASVIPPVIDLSLTKSVTPDRPAVGQVVTFTITAANAGPSDATGVIVSDVLPSGLSFVNSLATVGGYSGSDGRWNIGQINSGQSATLTLMATVDSATVSTNTAELIAANEFDSDSAPGNGDGTEDDIAIAVVTPANADLSLDKSVSTMTPNVGETVTFTLTASNAGPDIAEGVMIRDVLPTGLSFVSFSPNSGNFNPGTGIWSVPAISSGESLSLEIQATVESIGQKTNSAEIISSSQFDPDSTPANGIAAEDDQDQVRLTPQLVDLALTKTLDDERPNVGDSIVYRLELSNAGPSGATNVAVTDQLPAGVVFESAAASQGSYNAQTGVWTVGNVATGETPNLQISATVGNTRGETNTAEISFVDQPDVDSSPGNNQSGEDDQSSVSFTTQVANLSLQKSVDIASPNQNQNVNFTLTLSNAGPDNATAVTVRDLLPPGLVFESAIPSTGTFDSTSGTWSLNNVPAGTSAALMIEARVDLPSAQGNSVLTNTAEVLSVRQFDPNSTPGNGLAGEDDIASVAVTPPVVDIDVMARTDNAEPLEGDVILLTFESSNSGTINASGVMVRALVPDGLTILSAQPQNGSYDTLTGLWDIGALNAGSSSQLTVTARVDQRGLKQIPVQVVATDQFDVDSVPNNNVELEDDQTELTIRAPRLLTKRLFLSR